MAIAAELGDGGVDWGPLLRALTATPPQELAHLLASTTGDLLGGRDVVVYLVDFQHGALFPLPTAPGGPVHGEEDVQTSMAGRAFMAAEPVVIDRADGSRVWVPLFNRHDRIGVLALTLRRPDPRMLQRCVELATIAGLAISAADPTTDLFHVCRRGRQMALAASMQWDLLPPLTARTAGGIVTGLLEPAYAVAGDGFDYAVNGDEFDLALLDGMGHGVRSSLLAGLSIGAFRHGRRERHDLAELHRAIDLAVTDYAEGEAFTTGVVARLHLPSGQLAWTNAGHPPPLQLRGTHVVAELDAPPSLPFGLADPEVAVTTVDLQPGDRVVFYTDGVIEARAESGEEFGLPRLVDLVEREAAASVAVEETLRRLMRAVLSHQHEALQDDATLMILEWTGAA